MNIGMANSDDVPLSYKPSLRQIIVKSAQVYGVKAPLIGAIIACESSNNPLAHKLSKVEDSWGLSQINLKAHKDVTKEEAIDPDFAVDYLAKNIKAGHASMWTCNAKVHNKL